MMLESSLTARVTLYGFSASNFGITCSRSVFSNTPPYAATVSGVRCCAMAGRASEAKASPPSN